MLNENTDFACQVKFTGSKSSHSGIELVQLLSKVPRESAAHYKVPLSGSHHCYTSYT